jgi:putative IMPACT (imprinted ancient) family translation regulator
LGVSGLIQAYKESTAEVIAVSKIIEKTVDRVVKIDFDYTSMNGVMRIVKEMNPRIDEQVFDNICKMSLRIRESEAEILTAKLSKVEGVIIEE